MTEYLPSIYKVLNLILNTEKRNEGRKEKEEGRERRKKVKSRLSLYEL